MLTKSVMAIAIVAASTPPAANIIDLNALVSGGTGAGAVGAVYLLVKAILDRTMPSRSDARASTTLVLEGLNNMVKVLQDDKELDRVSLTRKQERIDELESAADVDYDRIRELRTEILDLQTRLSQKDRHINTLVRELRRLGSQVTGLDLDDIEITHPTEEVQKIRQRYEEQAEEVQDTGPTASTR